MEENSKQKKIRLIGIHIILILALLRFLVYPLHGVVAAKKAVFAEQYEAYQLRNSLLARQIAQPERKAKPVIDKSAVDTYLYDKEKGISYIQADVLEWLIAYAQEKGLTVLNFELPEASAGKDLTEISVLIRLSGNADALIDTLKVAGEQKRALKLKSLEITRSGKGLAMFLTISAFRMEI
ncbi:hypothetical protein [Desulfobacterium sp. N47]|uniref:General secretion pathway protein M n=1 Tax=uncultured Desulfobacterium sp. TaxID=201089 RepID=E1YBG4_9BACT|nr:hypothetical protein N47_G32320 [uncultured Desulfobacterium sp.]